MRRSGDRSAVSGYSRPVTINPLLVLVAVIVGVSIAVQAQFVGTMNRSVGTISSTFLSYAVGATVATVMWLMRGEPLSGARHVPGYAWSAGIFGLIIVGGMGYAAPRLGLSRAVVITVAAQLTTSVLLSHFGLLGASVRSVDLSRALGMALVVTGAWLVVRL